MAKKNGKIKIQEERAKILGQLKQTEQNISLLENQIHDQQVLKWKLVGALEYHEMIFDSDGGIKTDSVDKLGEPNG